MANWGMKISKQGVDVKTASDADLIFSTKYSMLKIVKIGNFSYTFSSNPGVGQITMGSVAHGLGYTPAHDSYYDDGASNYSHSPRIIVNGDLAGNYTLYIFTTYCDGTNIVFRFSRVDGGAGDPLDLTGQTINFKYYIFADEGA